MPGSAPVRRKGASPIGHGPSAQAVGGTDPTVDGGFGFRGGGVDTTRIATAVSVFDITKAGGFLQFSRKTSGFELSSTVRAHQDGCCLVGSGGGSCLGLVDRTVSVVVDDVVGIIVAIGVVVIVSKDVLQGWDSRLDGRSNVAGFDGVGIDGCLLFSRRGLIAFARQTAGRNRTAASGRNRTPASRAWWSR